MKTSDTILHALRRNVEQAKSKAGRKLAEDELASYLARKPSAFSRFVDSLTNAEVCHRGREENL